MATMASSGPGPKQKAVTSCRTPTWVVGAQIREPSSAAFSRPLAGSRIRSRTIAIQTGTHMLHWLCQQWFNMLYHNAGYILIYLKGKAYTYAPVSGLLPILQTEAKSWKCHPSAPCGYQSCSSLDCHCCLPGTR